MQFIFLCVKVWISKQCGSAKSMFSPHIKIKYWSKLPVILIFKLFYYTIFKVCHWLQKGLWCSIYQTHFLSKNHMGVFCRSSHSVRYRLHGGEVGSVGGAGSRGFLWTRSSSTLPHDLHQKHLGLLRRLHRIQMPVHAADNNSHVRGV